MARDCLSRRVVLVVLNRGHEFTASKSVQTELSPLVCSPSACLQLREIIFGGGHDIYAGLERQSPQQCYLRMPAYID